MTRVKVFKRERIYEFDNSERPTGKDRIPFLEIDTYTKDRLKFLRDEDKEKRDKKKDKGDNGE